MSKTKHFFYWLINYIKTLFFPYLFVKKGFRREWMTWKQYKLMTKNLKQTIY